MSNFTIWKYTDGYTIAQEWDELYDGKWPHGEKKEHIYIMKTKYPYYE